METGRPKHWLAGFYVQLCICVKVYRLTQSPDFIATAIQLL